jgi:regulatory protein
MMKERKEGVITDEKGRGSSAFDKALSILSRRMRTEYQITLALSKAGYDEDETQEAVARLKELGYLDDRAYAERFLEILIEKKRGRRRVRDEMRRHGLDSALVDETISAGFPEEVERENATALAEKALANLPDGADRRLVVRRVSLKLTSQGYGFDLIDRIIYSVVGDR